MNNWFYAVMTMFYQCSVFAVQNLWKTTSFNPAWLAAWQQSLVDMWFWTFCCHCKLVDSWSRQQKDNFSMVSKICNWQIMGHQTFCQRTKLLETSGLEIQACSPMYHVRKVRGVMWFSLIQCIQSLFLINNCYISTVIPTTYSSNLQHSSSIFVHVA